MRNLKFAFRTLFKTPFVTVVAILSLALGIGANAAIFSLFNQMLLQPLPVSDPTRLVNFGARDRSRQQLLQLRPATATKSSATRCSATSRRRTRPFTGIAAHVLFGVNLAMPGQTPVSGRGVFVSGSYFSVLGLRPALGRLLTPDDDETIGGNYVVVLSYAYWQTQLGSDPACVGKQITSTASR